jgi:hypothetical protein
MFGKCPAITFPAPAAVPPMITGLWNTFPTLPAATDTPLLAPPIALDPSAFKPM